MIQNIFKELKDKKELQKLGLKAYNSAVERMNNGLTETFNKVWESKGKDFGIDEYFLAHDRLFTKVWEEEAKKLAGKFTTEQILKIFDTFKIVWKKYLDL